MIQTLCIVYVSKKILDFSICATCFICLCLMQLKDIG